jgi:hypothetical protein
MHKLGLPYFDLHCSSNVIVSIRLDDYRMSLKYETTSAGYPLISYFTKTNLSTLGGFNIGGINASGQIPSFIGNYGLIDSDTPQSAFTKPSYTDPSQELQLVFSDEFNVDGRTFYAGDDPYWEAVDLHYWQVKNLFPPFPWLLTTYRSIRLLI